MATTDKLNRLKQTKADFKAVLIEKGQTPGDVFSEYPDMFRAIEGGGGEQATPEIEVSSNGLITATAGDKTAYKQLSTQGAKTITPGPAEQIAVAAGKYVTGDVKVAAVSSEPVAAPLAYVSVQSGGFANAEAVISEETFVTVSLPSGVRYYFNHAYLPEIPEEEAAIYPYAVIVAQGDETLHLWLSTKPAVMVVNPDNEEYYQLRIRGNRVRYYHSNKTYNEWLCAAASSDDSTYTYYNQRSAALWWSNHDIYWDDELYREAGAMLSQKPAEATAFLYNGFELPTFPEEFSLGDYPYHLFLLRNSTYYLYGFKERPYCTSGGVIGDDKLNYTGGYVRYTLSNNTWGARTTSTSDSSLNIETGYTFLWSNFTMYDSYGSTVWQHGSMPVPID